MASIHRARLLRRVQLGWAIAPLLVLALLMPVSMPSQQAPNPAANPVGASGQSAARPGPKSASHPAAGKKRKKKADPEPEPVVVTRPPDPPPPDWPVNAKPVAPAVEWNGRDLTVAATNSSLQQVLRDISTATGLKVEGLTGGPGDQRIFGSYGPAPARDVLSQLLQGSGYNVLMIGDQGEGTPRQLVLTAKSGQANAQPAQGEATDGDANQAGDDEPQEEPEQPEPPPVQRRPFGGPNRQPGMNRTPQQMLQEMQQRQLQQQQQQGAQPQQ